MAKKVGKATGKSQHQTQTKQDPTGTVAKVTSPLDLWYLCEKAKFAQLFAGEGTDGRKLYQRAMTRYIRMDNEAFKYHFPYIGEVGFDMTQSPPVPIMSSKDPKRPSSFPLSKFQLIKNGYRGRLLENNKLSVMRTEILISLDELEETLTPDILNKIGAIKPLSEASIDKMVNRPGLFRIPDVIRLKNYQKSGVEAFSPANIHTVIEIKFPGDILSREQRIAYLDIASGRRDKLRLLEVKEQCSDQNKKKYQRYWLREAQEEPVYRPEHFKPPLGIRTDTVCPLLTHAIEAEYQHVQAHFTQHWIESPNGHKLEPQNLSFEHAQQQQHKQAQGMLGAILSGPLVAVASAPLVGAASSSIATSALPSSASSEALVLTYAGKAIEFTKQVFPIAGATGAALAYANDSHTTSQLNKPLTRQLTTDFIDTLRYNQEFIYWEE